MSTGDTEGQSTRRSSWTAKVPEPLEDRTLSTISRTPNGTVEFVDDNMTYLRLENICLQAAGRRKVEAASEGTRSS